MEITGKVVSVLEPQSFTSKKDGSVVVKHFFVIETQGQYPKKVAFSVIGDEKFRQMNIVVGGTYNVSFDVESREWQGKWFSDVSAWRALRMDGAQAQQGQQAQSPTPSAQPAPQPSQQQEQPKDDLPF